MIDNNIDYSKQIKIFFFDIDSTTFDHNIKAVRDSTYLGLEKLRENGYKLCICTSRSRDEMRMLPQRYLDLMDGVVCIAGAYIEKEKEVHIIKIDDNRVKEVIKLFDENDVTYRYATSDGSGYLNRHDQDKEDLFYRLYTMVPEIKKYENEEVLHLLYYTDSEFVRSEIRRLMPEETHIILSFSNEAMPIGTSKSSGMIRLAKEFGFERENICAFGDANNDVDMLKEAFLGIAMGNGTEKAKNAADYVTDHISDEGLYNALVKFGFVK